MGTIPVGVHSSEFRADEKDLGGIVDPHENDGQGTGGPVGRPEPATDQIHAEKKFA